MCEKTPRTMLSFFGAEFGAKLARCGKGGNLRSTFLWTKLGPNFSANWGRCRPNPAKDCGAKIGQSQRSARSVDFGPGLANRVGQNLAELGRVRPALGQIWPGPVQFWSESAHAWSNSVHRFGRDGSTPGGHIGTSVAAAINHRPSSRSNAAANLVPNPTEIATLWTIPGQLWPKSGRIRSKSAHIGQRFARFGPDSAGIAEVWPNPGRI